MYSYFVEDLLKNKKTTKNDEESDNESEESEEKVTDDTIRGLILKTLEKMPNTPERQYLMQCASWDESEWNKGKWIAYSPIYNRYHGGRWPVYDISLSFSEKPEAIEFQSWKGDYEPETWNLPRGNLPYEGKSMFLRGSVWTRGE